MSVVDKIQHYQRNIEKCTDNEDRLLHCISKLYSLPVTVQHLQETGVGRTVNALRKYEGSVGNASKALVAKWKKMVADEETSDEDDEDEACVPDAPESYSDNPESPRFKEDVNNSNATKAPRHKSEDGKHKHRHKSEKSDASITGHNSKHILKQDSKSSDSKDSDMHKNVKSETEKLSKHDKSRHSHRHEVKSDKRSSSKDLGSSSKSSSTKHDAHISKDKSRSKSESSKSLDNNELNRTEFNDSSHKKRKLDSTSFDKKQSKRRKNSSGESDKECADISVSGKHTVNSLSNTASDYETGRKSLELKIKEEPSEYSSKEQITCTKTEVKVEKKEIHDKHRHSSSRTKSGESSHKSKDSEEKYKDKTESRENLVKAEKKDASILHTSKESHKSRNHHSSSSGSKDHSKSKDRNKKKDSKSDKDREIEVKSSKSSRKESNEKVKVKHEINGDEGIDCNSGASFAEALGMCTVAQPSKKRNNNSPSVVSKTVKAEPVAALSVNSKKTPSKSESTSNDDPLNPPSLLAPNIKLEPLSVDLASTLPEISPNYKPLPFVNPVHRKDEDKILNDVIYVKNQRTKVYSGNKSGYTSVPTLCELCIRVLIENIDALEVTGGVPYDIIKPVVERATADQLFMLEHYNPYLIESTDPLWQYHCTREFRNKKREEMETWREMYMRCLDEREAKLKTLTANIKQSIDKSVPLRSTKLAYVDNIVKPPRNVLKKQAKYGTANSTTTSTSDLKKKLITSGGAGGATNISVPPPPMSRARTSSSGVVKKTKAPLMAKALQLIKGRYKR